MQLELCRDVEGGTQAAIPAGNSQPFAPRNHYEHDGETTTSNVELQRGRQRRTPIDKRRTKNANDKTRNEKDYARRSGQPGGSEVASVRVVHRSRPPSPLLVLSFVSYVFSYLSL